MAQQTQKKLSVKCVGKSIDMLYSCKKLNPKLSGQNDGHRKQQQQQKKRQLANKNFIGNGPIRTYWHCLCN